MTSYLIIDLQITDLEGFLEYVRRIPDMIARHQGRYLVEGVLPEVVEGELLAEQRSVVLQFPSRECVDAFLKERAASDLHDIWAATTSSRILLVEGNAEESHDS